MPEEPITVKIEQLTPYPISEDIQPDDLLFILRKSTGVLCNARIDQLPFGSGGGGSIMLGSPFKARLTDTAMVQVVEVTPGSGNWNTIISDVRLVDRTDYPVSSSQLQNAAFRDGEITYDADNGIVTILNFKLLAGEFVILFPDGKPTSSGGGNFQALKDQVDFLTLMLAPFIPTLSGENGGRVLWNRPIDEIPPGWVADDTFDGRVPVGQSVGDADFGGAISTVTGNKTYTLLTTNLPDFTYSDSYFNLLDTSWRSGGSASPGNGTGGDATRTRTYTGGKIPFKIIQPSIIVKWIKFVGL